MNNVFSPSFTPEKSDYDAFIAYAHQDQTFVRQLSEKLAKVPQNIRINGENISSDQEIITNIKSQIEAANNFIFIMSFHSINSVACHQQLTHAIECNKRLIPLVLEDVGHENLHPELSRINWIFCEKSSDLEGAIEQLVIALKTDFNHVRYHTHLLRRATEWERKNYHTDFLLLGTHLEEAEQWLIDGQTKSPKPTLLQHNYLKASRNIQRKREAAELKLRRLTPQQFRNRQILLNKVRSYWIKGVLENSIYEKSLIELGLEDCLDAVASPWRITINTNDTNREELPPDVSVLSLFDQLGEGRTLLILGEPGAGKTTTLLQLTKALVERAENRLDERIPVVFNLSSWSTKYPNFSQWLIEELNTKYQVPKTVGKTWINQQQLLLLLDGLDEVLIQEREQCLMALNQFHQNYSPEMVVCSRFKDYNNLSNRLNFQKAIYLKPLTLSQIMHCLDDYKNQINLTSLCQLIKENKAVQELVNSPLMLNIILLAYQQINIKELSHSRLVEETRQQLFNTYIEQMFKRRNFHYNYSKKQSLRYLNWLAKQMKKFSKTVFLIEEIQPSWLFNETQKRLYQISTRVLLMTIWGSVHLGSLAFHHSLLNQLNFMPYEGLIRGIIGGIIAGTIYGIIGGLTSDLSVGWQGKVANGLLLGTTFGGMFGWVWQSWDFALAYGSIYGLMGILIDHLIKKEIEPIDRLQWSWRKVINNSIFGLGIGIILMLTQVASDPIQGLVFGLMVSLIFGFEKKNEVTQTIIPNQGIWNSVINTATLFMTIGVLTALLMMIIISPNSGLIDGLISGGVNGLILGLLSGLIGGQGSGIACLKHFVLRVILGSNHYIPKNYARFLNEATERIFLQKVGGGYIFMHRSLLEHFAQI